MSGEPEASGTLLTNALIPRTQHWEGGGAGDFSDWTQVSTSSTAPVLPAI